ncbi:hypothetical protein [Breoghania sp.]|uniref:hypothetical protein n=1 Tax=Breoghania sp. TaxID=2065378 RepID=UPI002AA78298|nr:hypothetical protein [Breoghania sp.]
MRNSIALRRTATATAFMAAVLAGAAVIPVHAQDLPTGLSEAREALADAWSKAPLSFAAATFTTGPARGFGEFDPKADAVFAPGEAINVYAEPVAFGYGDKDGLASVELVAGFELRNTTGQILASNGEFARLTAATRHPVREFPASLSYHFDGLTAGDYVLVTHFSDANSDKAGSFSLPFTVTAAQ